MVDALRDDDLVLEPTGENAGFRGWAVMLGDSRIGSIALRVESRTTRSVRWNVGTSPAAMQLAVRALRLVVDHAFASGIRRVEARVPVDRTQDLRAASIVGLRHEGLLRGHGNEPDRAFLGRLADDPALTTRDGFIAILNAGLPTKRVIGQGLMRDRAGRVLLCELTYKTEWDLPGGVIEVGEPPAAGLIRELEEELGIEVAVQDLITVNWLPAWRGWDDACVFLFDLGTQSADIIDSMTFQTTEIVGVHWCTPEEVRARGTAAAIELLAAVDAGNIRAYREAPLAPE